jgi:hypothetical protein
MDLFFDQLAEERFRFLLSGVVLFPQRVMDLICCLAKYGLQWNGAHGTARVRQFIRKLDQRDRTRLFKDLADANAVEPKVLKKLKKGLVTEEPTYFFPLLRRIRWDPQDGVGVNRSYSPMRSGRLPFIVFPLRLRPRH